MAFAWHAQPQSQQSQSAMHALHSSSQPPQQAALQQQQLQQQQQAQQMHHHQQPQPSSQHHFGSPQQPNGMNQHQPQQGSFYGQAGAMQHVNHMAMPNGSPSTFLAQGATSNADMSSLWGNYPSDVMQSQFSRPSDQQLLQHHQQQQQLQQQKMSNAGGLRPNPDQTGSVAPMSPSSAAAAAVAAYGQIGYPQGGPTNMTHQMGMVGASSSAVNSNNSPMHAGSPWTNAQGQGSYQQEQQQQQMMKNQKLVSVHLPVQRVANIGGGYEGDASNSSSTQTPGASSGEDSSGAKRRRATATEAELHRISTGQNFMLYDGTSDEGNLRRFSEELSNQNPSSLQRPALRHRRSHSGSQAQLFTSKTTDNGLPASLTKRLSGSGSSLYHSHNSLPAGSFYTPLAGHAASHPPGLGSQVLRGVDVGMGGSNAATDFTKRKGWYNRIVDELLDFVHVLDSQARVLYAASSVGTLTGWKLEELHGKAISDFIHPDDAPAFMKELKRCFAENAEMTTYYRFRKKPRTAEDKKRVRDQKAATSADQARSGSTSENESSSNQDSDKAKPSVTTFGDETAEQNEDDETDLRDDSADHYVIFEITGHPYFAPPEEGDTKEGEGENDDGKSGSKSNSATGANRPRSASQSSAKARKSLEGASTASDATRNVKLNADGQATNSTGAVPNGVQCFFCSGRVYPTKNVGMLDSFLEFKLENERLRKMLSELSVNDGTGVLIGDGSSDGRRSLEDGHGAYPIDYPQDLDTRTNSLGHGAASIGSSETAEGTTNRLGRKSSVQSIPYGTGAGQSTPTSPLTTHLERSMTNNSIGGLTVGGTATGSATGGAADEESDDAASPSFDPDDPKRKKKKPKQEEGDYVCTDCGRVDSPEWRKGPLGPKTLCNACGLRWAKKIKRSGGDPDAVSKAGAAARLAQSAAASSGLIIGQQAMLAHGGGNGQPHSSPVSASLPPSHSSHFASGHHPSMERPPLLPTSSTNSSLYGSAGLTGSFIEQQQQHQHGMFASHSSGPGSMGYGQGAPNGAGGMPALVHHSSSYMSQPSSQMGPPGQAFQYPSQQQDQQHGAVSAQQRNASMFNGGLGAPNGGTNHHSLHQQQQQHMANAGINDYLNMG